MIRKVSYESQERREKQVLAALNANGISSVEEANQICEEAGVDPYLPLSPSRRVLRQLLMQPRPSVSVCRASASPVL